MASTDKALGRLSAWSTLLVLAGVAALPLLPAHKLERDGVPPRTDVQAPAHAPAEGSTAAPQTAPDLPKSDQAPAEPVADVWTETEQAAALRECLRLLAPVAADIALEEPLKHKQCGTPAPVLLRSIGAASKVEFGPAPMMNCRLAAGLARWVETVLQPAAREVLGSRIARIVGASSYACRNVYNSPDLPLSEHATGNAVDITGFVTADGRTIGVAKGWGPTERDIAEAQKKVAEAAKAAAKKKEGTPSDDKPASSLKEAAKDSDAKENLHKTGLKPHTRPPVVAAAVAMTAAKTSESAFLKRLHRGACSVFGTVLGPEANEAHRDHFHFDMKERKTRGVCH
jgi:hypothetical protein